MSDHRLWLALAALVYAAAAPAVPAVPSYLPSDDAQVLERRSVDPGSLGQLRGLRSSLDRNPRDPRVAAVYARRALELGRASGDPRYFGQAEAVLASWTDPAHTPTEILLLRALIAQRRHAFAEARAGFDAVLEREALNAEALLNRAVLSMVQGDPAEALIDCSTLLVRGPRLPARTCIAAAQALNGSAPSALQALMSLTTDHADAPEEERAWATTLAAETAERLGRDPEAERLYRAALPLAQGHNLYTVLAFADFLLRQDRGGEVTRLLQSYPATDGVLLRRAQALRGSVESQTLIGKLARRQAEEALRGPSAHLREQAMLALLRGQAAQGLQLAIDNWALQKEPLDAIVLVECAIASRQPQAAAGVKTWMRGTRLEDRRIARLLAQLDAVQQGLP